MTDPEGLEERFVTLNARMLRGEGGAQLDEDLSAYVEDCRVAGGMLYARALQMQAGRYLFVGNHERARVTVDSVLALVEGSNTRIEIDAIVLKARLHLAVSVRTAIELYEHALDVAARTNMPVPASLALRYGEALATAARFREALLWLRQAERAYERQDDSQGLALTLLRTTLVQVHTGAFEAMFENASEALRLSEIAGNPSLTANAMKFMCVALTRLQRLAEAYEVAQRAITFADLHHLPTVRADLAGCLGDVYLRMNDAVSALQQYYMCRTLYHNVGLPHGEALAVMSMAHVYAQAGDVQTAMPLFDEAISTFTRLDHERNRHDAIVLRAAASLQQQDVDAAETALQQLVDHQGLEWVGIDVVQGLLACAETRQNRREVARLRRILEQQRKHHHRTVDVDDVIRRFRAIVTPRTIVQLPSPDTLANEKSITPPVTVAPTPVLNPTSTSSHRFTVRLLGTFSVQRFDEVLTPEHWKRKKARDIFKFLVTRHRRAVTVDELAIAVWGDDVDVESILPTLQNGMSAIRTALEPDIKPRQPSTYLLFRDGTYTLDLGDDAEIDLLSFDRLLRAALDADEGEKINLLRQATDLYSGDLLPDDRFEAWTTSLRDETKHRCIEAMTELSELYYAHGNIAAGTAVARRILDLDDTYEDAYEILFANLAAEGRYADAERIYDRCREAYQREYLTEPPGWMRTLLLRDGRTPRGTA